ncbi:hypothetical protein AVEN_200767-1 [Araneus ventricosus]|uniref:Uncharacterized protein n=1 Tax=Araneus ventricosus TaxID=182803 RepID=A0A4Y2DYE6_ARAVE|nr:hypothetical protein AVEN_200767-1 [Araneus ventricosus]
MIRNWRLYMLNALCCGINCTALEPAKSRNEADRHEQAREHSDQHQNRLTGWCASTLEVHEFLNNAIPNRWIGHARTNDKVMFPCPPPRSPDITPCDFFMWGFVKDKVFVPPLPHNLEDLQTRIGNALKLETPDMLKRVWEEMDCRLDVIRMTLSSHIEHL